MRKILDYVGYVYFQIHVYVVENFEDITTNIILRERIILFLLILHKLSSIRVEIIC